jgi:hypothetical protein
MTFRKLQNTEIPSTVHYTKQTNKYDYNTTVKSHRDVFKTMHCG